MKITIEAEWRRVGRTGRTEWILEVTDTGFDEAVIASVTENRNAFPSHRWDWRAGGSTYWAPDAETAKRHAELRLTFPSHHDWCDHAEKTGIMPKE